VTSQDLPLLKTGVTIASYLVTFRVSRRRREMYCITRVCVSVCPRPHAYTIAQTRMQHGGVVGDSP